MAYWGLGTTFNKFVWTLVLLTFLSGSAVFIPGVVYLAKQCNSDVQDCIDKNNQLGYSYVIVDGQQVSVEDYCKNQYSNHNCHNDKPYAIKLVCIGAVLLVIIIPLMLSYFAFCASRPKQVPATTAQTYQMNDAAAWLSTHAPGSMKPQKPQSVV